MAAVAGQMDKLVALCKRRGFIFQSSEIYGGINGFWDYGPLGCEIKRLIKEAWWHDMVLHPPAGPDGRDLAMVGLDCAIIMNPRVWEASGHVGGFADPMVECQNCNGRFRVDQLAPMYLMPTDVGDTISTEEAMAMFRADPSGAVCRWVGEIGEYEAGKDLGARHTLIKNAIRARKIRFEPAPVHPWNLCLVITDDGRKYYIHTLPVGADQVREGDPCPRCTAPLSKPRQFNLMLKTHIGALEDSSSLAYFRPETAQGIFVNYRNVLDTTRVKIPFGIAQMGKAFRNEINPRNYTFRSREFEQMEIEFFCHEKDSMTWWEFWRDVRIDWYKKLGLAGQRLRPRNQTEKELAHYSKACTDIEYLFPFADEPQELEGVAHRGCFDLTQHQQHSGKDMSYFDDETRERFIPTVVEPSAGADRATLAFLCEAYSVDESRPSPEIMRFSPRLAPIKAAVFPLVNRDSMPERAERIYRAIRQRWPAQFDAKQSIGKRYARMDEAGTPFCITIDGQTLADGTVTVRDRDDGSQVRVHEEQVVRFLEERLSGALARLNETP